MNSPFVIELEDKVCALTTELLEMQLQLQRTRKASDWQEKNVEDCLGTLGVNLRQLMNVASDVKTEIVMVRNHQSVK